MAHWPLPKNIEDLCFKGNFGLVYDCPPGPNGAHLQFVLNNSTKTYKQFIFHVGTSTINIITIFPRPTSEICF